MDKARILIVDDEPGVRLALERTLKSEDYVLETAAGGVEALAKLNLQVAGQAAVENTSYDLILLDLRMEPVGGLQVLEAAHQKDPDTVVILLTAHSTIQSAVDALRLGAFDYLFKPATPDAIRQRVREGLEYRRQAVRRQRLASQIENLRLALQDLEVEQASLNNSASRGRFLRSGELIIDRHHRTATLAGSLLDLTTTEFDFLVCLVEASPNPATSRQLVNYALSYDCEDAEASEIVKVHIHRLRQKLEPNPSDPRYIRTVRYKGYLWVG